MIQRVKQRKEHFRSTPSARGVGCKQEQAIPWGPMSEVVFAAAAARRLWWSRLVVKLDLCLCFRLSAVSQCSGGAGSEERTMFRATACKAATTDCVI